MNQLERGRLAGQNMMANIMANKNISNVDQLRYTPDMGFATW